MSSSPERREFRHSNTGCLAEENVTGAARQPKVAPILRTDLRSETSDQLELKLAAARAEGIREGLQQAQQSSNKQLTDERAKVAEAIRAFAQKTNEYYSRAEIELVHLSLAIAAKILHREAQVDRMLVAALVKVAHGEASTRHHRHGPGTAGRSRRLEPLL